MAGNGRRGKREDGKGKEHCTGLEMKGKIGEGKKKAGREEKEGRTLSQGWELNGMEGKEKKRKET